VTRYGLSTVIVDELPRDRGIAKIAEAGFQLVELLGHEGHLEYWTDNPQETRSLLEAWGIRARSVHAPKRAWDLANAEAAARLACVDAATVCFHQAAEVGAEVVVVHANSPTTKFTEEEYELNWSRSRDSLSVLAERAQQANIRMAVENLPARHEPRPTATVAEVLAMIDGLGDHVGICLDAGHANANGRSAASEALEAGEKLFAVHIQDNNGRGMDQHLIPGHGSTDWDAFLAALDMIQFEGPRNFEVPAGNDLDETLAELAALRVRWEAR